MSKKKISLRAPGRPPAPTSAFGIARPKKPKRSAPVGGAGLGAGLGAMPLGGAPSPMQGVSLSQPTGSFSRGGSVHRRMASDHDDKRLHKGHSEHGHAAHRDMCRGGVK